VGFEVEHPASKVATITSKNPRIRSRYPPDGAFLFAAGEV